MTSVVLVFHVLIAICLIGLVLVQQSDGGGLGMGGSNNFMNPRGTANLLTRATNILAGIFFVTSLTLVILSGSHSGTTQSILDSVPAPVTEQAPEAPAAPSVPIQ